MTDDYHPSELSRRKRLSALSAAESGSGRLRAVENLPSALIVRQRARDSAILRWCAVVCGEDGWSAEPDTHCRDDLSAVANSSVVQSDGTIHAVDTSPRNQALRRGS